eukprot:gene6611-9078_t
MMLYNLLINVALFILVVDCYKFTSVNNRIKTHSKVVLFDQVRVKLNSDVKNIGKKGEIVKVSSAMFTNMLLPKKAAVRVSDEEMEQMNVKQKAEQQKEKSRGLEVLNLISGLPPLVIKRKVGNNGQLFGSVSVKQIGEEIKDKLQLENNRIIVEEIKIGELSTSEVRKAGRFKAIIKVIPIAEIASVDIDVTSEA